MALSRMDNRGGLTAESTSEPTAPAARMDAAAGSIGSRPVRGRHATACTASTISSNGGSMPGFSATHA